MYRLLPIARVAGLAGFLVATGATACGSETALEAGAPAQKTARVEILVQTSDGTRVERIRTTGVIDYGRSRSDYVTEAPLESRTITIGDVTYARAAGEADPALPEGKRWLRTDGDMLESQFEESEFVSEDGRTSTMVFVDAPSVRTPDGYLAELEAVTDELRTVRREEVRGVPTTRLRAAVHERRATRHQLETAGWKQANIERYLESLLDSTTAVEVWVDDDGLVRRIVEEVTAPAGFAAPGAPMPTYVTTTEFFDFGVEADIEAPPADEVGEWAEWSRLWHERHAPAPADD